MGAAGVGGFQGFWKADTAGTLRWRFGRWVDFSGPKWFPVRFSPEQKKHVLFEQNINLVVWVQKGDDKNCFRLFGRNQLLMEFLISY